MSNQYALVQGPLFRPVDNGVMREPLVRPIEDGIAQETWLSPLDGFTRTFNNGQEIEESKFGDQFVGARWWISGGKNREGLLQMSMRHAAKAVASSNHGKAERAVYAFARQLMCCGLVDTANDAMRFGAMHYLGESTKRDIDLSDIAMREAVFERLISAGLAVRTDTSVLPSEWGLGESWILIKQPLDHGQFDEESRKFFGIPLLQRKIDPTRPDVDDGKKRLIPPRRTESDIDVYRRAWLEKIDQLERAGLPVALPLYHVNDNVSVRSWRSGARRWNLHFPQVGLSPDEVGVAENEFNEVVKRGRETGFWNGLADWQIARNVVYQLSGSEKRQWIVIEP